MNKLFADGQVWRVWDYSRKEFINDSNTVVSVLHALVGYKDFHKLEGEHPPQHTETPIPQEFSSKQGDCIASKVHSLCVELQLMYSYLPAAGEFLVDYDGMEFKLKTSEDIGKLRHMISLMEELRCE